MSADARWQRYWRFLTSAFRAEVDDEIAFHIAMRARELERTGLPPDEAEAEARRRFGDREEVRNTLHGIERRRGRRMRWAFIFQELGQDLRYGARALLKRPSYALMTAGSLALGIAAVTVVLSIVDALLLRPLPVRDPDELVVVAAGNNASGAMAIGTVGLPTVRDIAARTDLFQDVAAQSSLVAGVRRPGGDAAQRAIFLTVTGNYFGMLGVPAALGRTLIPDDDRLRQRVLVLGYSTWQQTFGGDSSIIGSTVRLNTVEYEVAGVAPSTFPGTEYLFRPWGYIPIGTVAAIDPTAADIETRRSFGRFTVLARRRRERSLEEIGAAMSALATTIETAYPSVGEGYRLPVFSEQRSRPSLASAGAILPITIVFATLALLVLVTASVNATNLILARGSTRATEFAVRQALGASRWRLARQLLVEVLLVALLGAVAALGMARAAIGSLTSVPLVFDGMELSYGIQLDTRVLMMTLAFAVAVGLLAGLGPALSASRFALQQQLREGGRAGLTRRGRRVRGALVVAQVAASLVVLVCAALFTASARQGAKVDLGFRAERIGLFGVDATMAHYGENEARRAFERIERDVEAIPGVSSAVWATAVPIKKGAAGISEVQGDGATPIGLFTSDVGAGYFGVMGIAVLEGRDFAVTDDSTRPGVVVINQRAAELLWPGGSAPGRIIRLDPSGPPVEVIGVVRNSRYLVIGESPRPFMYRALAQHYAPARYLHVRTEGDLPALMPAVRAAISAADPELAPYEVETMEQTLDESPNGTLLLRLGAGFSTAIGGLAVALTLLGLYGVIVFTVAQRTKEIGLRMALGATRWAVVRSILADGGKLAVLGVAIGLGGAIAVSRMIGSMLVGSRSADVLIFTAVPLALGVAALLSAWLPARRASRIDPVRALGEE